MLLSGNPRGHGDAPLARVQAGKAAAPGTSSSIAAAPGDSDTSSGCRNHGKDQVFQTIFIQGIKMGETFGLPHRHSFSPSRYHLSAVMDAGAKHAGGLILLRWSTCQRRQGLGEAAQLGYLWPFEAENGAACIVEEPSRGKTSQRRSCTVPTVPSIRSPALRKNKSGRNRNGEEGWGRGGPHLSARQNPGRRPPPVAPGELGKATWED